MTLLEHHEPLESVDFNSSAQQLVSAGDDGRALVWDVDSGTLLYELADPALGDQAHAARINRAIFSPDDTLIATASWDKTAKLWDLASRDALVLRGHDDRVENVAFNTDGSLLATASDDGTARIWSTADGACLISLLHSSEANNEDVRKVYGVRFHPREPYLITTGGDGAVRGWLIAAEQLQRAGGCDEAQGQVAAAALEFAPDEQCQANSANCTVHDAAFNTTGTRLATVAWNSQVILRDFPAGSNQQAFTGHTRRLYGVQFSPDGANLATSGADGTVRIWDLETGQAQQVLPGPEFNFLDYSDDGQVLAAAGEDGTARLYALQLAELVDLAQGRLTRQKLTPAECARYALQDSALCP
jgi:WD40 repeat protein